MAVEPDGGDGSDSFRGHAERMRLFRRSHAAITIVNGLMFSKPALPESTWPLLVHCPMMETGGARLLDA